MTEYDKRISDREKCYAKLILSDDHLPGYIRDVSILGFRIEIPADIDIQPGKTLDARVHPLEEMGGSPFGVTLEVRWVKKDPPFTAVGMKLLDLSSDQARLEYNRLIEYYDTNLRD